MPHKTSKSGHDDGTINIDALLAEAGFDTPASRKRARAELERAGLTNARKGAIAVYKRALALKLLHERLACVCGAECGALLADAREPVVTAGHSCEVCLGSNNRRASLAAARALERGGVKRVLVVGGTPTQQQELARLLAPTLTLEFVDGTRSHSQRDALANMKRVQMVVIWGATPLRHAVSDLYTSEPLPHLRVVAVSKRGIEALCREIERNMTGGGRR